MLTIIKNNLITFALYYVVTIIVLSLMHEPSQAILVWPAVGVGIIVALVWGFSILPALYAAQLLINFQLSGKTFFEFTLNDWTLTHLLLFAGVFRCYLGAYLVKYFVGYPNALVSNKSIFNFFFVAGPLTALVSTVLFNSIQYHYGYLDMQNLSNHFFDWWFGDVLGFMIFAPLTMVLICQPKTIWKSRYISFGFPVILIFLGVVFLFNRTQVVENQSIKQNLNIKSDLISSKIEQKISHTQHLASDVTNIFKNNQNPLDQFKSVLSTNSEEIDALVWQVNDGVEYTVASENYDSIKFVKLKQTDFSSMFNEIKTKLGELSTILYSPNLNSFVNKFSYTEFNNTVTIYIVNDFSAYIHSYLNKYELEGVNFDLKINEDSESLSLVDSGGLVRGSKFKGISSKFKFNKDQLAFEIVPTSIYLSKHQVKSNSLIAKLSLLFTGLIGIMLLVITGKATLTDIKVKERTLELDIEFQNLKESKIQYQKLVEQHPVVLWRLDLQTRKMIYISQKVSAMFGYQHRHWINRKDFWLKAIHSEDLSSVKDQITKAVNKQVNFELQYRLVKSNRSQAWINDVVNVVKKNGRVVELVGLMIDVSEIKKAKEQQGISESRYKALFTHAFDPLILLEPNSKQFIDANEKAKKLFGIDIGFSDYTLSDFLPEKQTDGSLSERHLFKYISAAKINNNASFTIQMKDGKNREIIGEVNMIKLPGEEKNLLLTSINDITLKRKHEMKINQLAYYDNLTGLPNREHFYTKFEFYLEKAQKIKQYGSITYIDLDRFKILNDSLGHQAGDQLLQMVAKRIRSVTDKNEFCARLGGDEFIVLTKSFNVDHENKLESSLVKAELILEALNEPYFIGDYEHLITPSIGISLFPHKKSSIDEIIHHADVAMYSSKSKGKNTISVYRENMDRLVSQRLEFEKGIRLAFEKKEFELHYQPQVNEKNQIEGVEALLRWSKLRNFGKNIEDLIETIEEIGLTHELRHWVFDEACYQLKEWEHNKHPIQSVAVNVSAKQFHQKNFIDQVKSIIESYEVNPSQIVVELTEQAIIEDVDGLIRKLNILNEYGIRTSLDDFGTGYSSLSYLKQLPIQQLKIDKMFVWDMTEDKKSQHIVKTIINLAEMMEIELVAEGIETDTHYELLKDLGCKQFQGYYFSRPLPGKDVFRVKL